ncbi:MAG: ABC transporter permease [Bacteroidales bacterium]|nr:ABC transporter permease [Bacteroidales bacterium]
MALIVSLFLGLTVSAEEIFRDRKILKRESFLNLSRSSYLLSKIVILFVISAIQAFSFIIIANSILGLKGMYMHYWFVLFSTAAFANMLGLNVSASFNSAVTIYILIPLLMIPMMILSGAMFSFDKLNRKVSSVGKVPVIAEFMVTKWAYEALMVHQFKDNEYKKNLFELEKIESTADFKTVHLIPGLRDRLEDALMEFLTGKGIKDTEDNVYLLRNEIEKELRNVPEVGFEHAENITPENFSRNMADAITQYLNDLEMHYRGTFQDAVQKKEYLINYWLDKSREKYFHIMDTYDNESVSDIVKKVYEKNPVVEYDNELTQQIHPIYQDPVVKGFFDFRSHFFAPRKHFAGKYYDTYWFNVMFIWLLTFGLYATLYFELLKRLLNLGSQFKRKK